LIRWKVRSYVLNTPTNLLICEAGGGLEILEDELYETPSQLEKAHAEEIIIISGTLTVSP
jgi:hypothetical protein